MLYDPKWEQKTDNSLASILMRARSLIETPDKWCQYALQDNLGRMCAVGAINTARGADLCEYSEAQHFIQSFIGTHLTTFNDNRAHAEVLALFDRAISAALTKGKCE